jgi:hypothetical protein
MKYNYNLLTELKLIKNTFLIGLYKKNCSVLSLNAINTSIKFRQTQTFYKITNFLSRFFLYWVMTFKEKKC